MEWRKVNRHLARVLIALALLSSGCTAHAAEPETKTSAAFGPIELSTHPIRWNPATRNDVEAGELEWAGGIRISSSNPRFGGWSGLSVSADGSTLIAMSDKATWMTAQILYDEKGRLSGVGAGKLAPMLDREGKPLKGKNLADAEGFTVVGDDILRGDAYVSFERSHRIWHYPFGKDGFAARPNTIVSQRQLGKLPVNEGVEALAAMPPFIGGEKQRLLAITENARDPRGNVRAFLVEGQSVKRLSLHLNEPFHPTDVAVLPDGDYLLLERSFSLLAGAGMQLRLIAKEAIKPGAVIRGKVLLDVDRRHTIDNMEGLAIRADRKGDVWVYVISDDNFSPLQHTYLMMFRMKRPAVPQPEAAKPASAAPSSPPIPIRKPGT
jgi:hypothetical protein